MPKRRRVSRTNASFGLLILVGIFILGIFYSLTGKDPVGIFDATATSTILTPTQMSPVSNAPTAVNASGAWWEVYFTDPVHVKDPANWNRQLITSFPVLSI